MKKSELKKLIKEEIQNLSELKVYHGDSFNTSKLDPKWMLHQNSNNQEGVGIYFSDDIETAKSYGKNIISTNVDKKDFVNSRNLVSKYINKSKIVALLKAMTKIDKESMFYFMSDYTYLEKPENINALSYEKTADMLLKDEIRNMQISLAEVIGVENFVKLWNSIIKIDGTYYKNGKNIFYAIINPNYKAMKENKMKKSELKKLIKEYVIELKEDNTLIKNIKKKYNVHSVEPMYSDKNRLEIIDDNFNLLQKINKEIFNNKGHIEKLGNLQSMYVLYQPKNK